MKIISWNVNGLRSMIKKKYLDELIEDKNPDILCISETKLGDDNIKNQINDQIKIKYPQYKYRYWSNSENKLGYSGTAIFMKKKPLNLIYGINYESNNELNNEKEFQEFTNFLSIEGRIIAIELKKFYLINIYTPNSGEALNRLDWRINIWDKTFKNFIEVLQKNKPVVICGDLNVAHKAIDLKNPRTNLRTAGYTIEERNSFDNFLNECELLDAYRILNPDKIEYTYWSYRRNSREKNIGWRIDYFLLSKILKKKIKECLILLNILGSDHAPIELIINNN
jgi:exodeoxyribonuclease III